MSVLWVFRVGAFLAGAYIVVSTGVSAVMTFVLPRAANVRIARAVFICVRRGLDLWARPSRSFEDRDRVLSLQAPLSLIGLPVGWLLLVMAGFTAMFWGLGTDPLREAFALSGSSIFTLGFERPTRLAAQALSFAESAIGLGLVALLISYLPTIYAGFSRRETAVAMLEALAGAPPSPTELLRRHHRIGGIDRLDPLWRRWQEWFADIEESHTTIAALVFFRSPDPDRHWVTAAGCILDSAALTASTLNIPRSADAELCIRAGYVALRRIADFFAFTYDPSPRPDDPISVRREEFVQAYEDLARAGLPVQPDAERAWKDFAGWRVNYDEVLRKLAGMVVVPESKWLSDRVFPWKPAPLWSALRRIPRAPRHHE